MPNKIGHFIKVKNNNPNDYYEKYIKIRINSDVKSIVICSIVLCWDPDSVLHSYNLHFALYNFRPAITCENLGKTEFLFRNAEIRLHRD